VNKLANYGEEILLFHNSDTKLKQQAIGASLKLFLIYCNNICTIPKEETQLIQAGHSILKNFKSAVEKHHTKWHSSAEYASFLNITSDHLNRTIKSLIGKTAKQYIQTRVIIAGKRLLYFSDLSTKEIGYQLGFSEASNFSAFFKKETKLSPSDFRKTR
jgi:AraC-like DNA-binding protein